MCARSINLIYQHSFLLFSFLSLMTLVSMMMHVPMVCAQSSVPTFKTSHTNGSAGHGVSDSTMPGGTTTPGTPNSKSKVSPNENFTIFFLSFPKNPKNSSCLASHWFIDSSKNLKKVDRIHKSNATFREISTFCYIYIYIVLAIANDYHLINSIFVYLLLLESKNSVFRNCCRTAKLK